MLDRNKPYGSVCGFHDSNAAFEQGGKLYNIHGEELVDGEKGDPAPKKEPTPPKSNSKKLEDFVTKKDPNTDKGFDPVDEGAA